VTEDSGSRPPVARRRAERLLGAPAEAGPPRPPRERGQTPRSVRWAAVVVGVEAAACVVAAAVLAWLTVTGRPDSVKGAVAQVVVALLAAAGLGACAAGLWRLALWARGPVVALQLIIGALGYTAAFQYGAPQFGVPALVLVAVELYLLATPEARLAFYRRR
jgi:hypothetical protein